MHKIYTIGYAGDYSSWMQAEHVPLMEEADVVLLTGGADISPSLYGEPRHPTTMPHEERDRMEIAEAYRAIALKKPIIGICRGAQLLCVLAGGKLIQHQQDNRPRHPCYLWDGRAITVSSCHHQAMYPWKLPHGEWKKLGHTNFLSKFHLGGNGEEMVNDVIVGHVEIEIAYFPKIRGLGIQSHPEFMFPPTTAEEHESIFVMRELFKKLIAGVL